MRTLLVIALMTYCIVTSAQSYFPPLTGPEWDSIDIDELNWCQNKIDSLHAFLEDKNSKSFIILKGGRIADEHYVGTFTQDSLWYWASAGKTLVSMLVGCAQEDGLLDIEDRTSDYLGSGWTSALQEKEDLIKIRHQLSMTTGLDYGVVDQNCLDPDCLNYHVDAGGEWFYYNAPYRLLSDVLASASSQNIDQFTYQRLGQRIGMGGFWFQYVRYSKARDMARFGLLALNNGLWDQDAVLGDMNYLENMSIPSQPYNEAYGYLWWLNGGESFMLPTLTLTFPGGLIENAPDDTYAALGLNDQKIYVVPSLDMVVVRQGNSAGQALAGPSSFDSDLWSYISDLECEPDGLDDFSSFRVKFFPNPVRDVLNLDFDYPDELCITIYSIHGVELQNTCAVRQLDVNALEHGVYVALIRTDQQATSFRFIKE